MTLDWIFGNSELQLREQDEAGVSSFREYQRIMQFRHCEVLSRHLSIRNKSYTPDLQPLIEGSFF